MNMKQRRNAGHEAIWWSVLVFICLGIIAWFWFFGVHASKDVPTQPVVNVDEAMVMRVASTAETSPTIKQTSESAKTPVSSQSQSKDETTLNKPARSPYPLPGEKFDKPIAPKLLVSEQQAKEMSIVGALQAKPGQIIPWDHARQYVGQTITVEGKVVLTNKTRTVCFLNFTQDWRGRFYVILFEGVLSSWPQSPDKYFLNKTLHITGEVKERKGIPQIQVEDPNQIKIVN